MCYERQHFLLFFDQNLLRMEHREGHLAAGRETVHSAMLQQFNRRINRTIIIIVLNCPGN